MRICYFLAGFLINSVAFRLHGELPSNDIIYPLRLTLRNRGETMKRNVDIWVCIIITNVWSASTKEGAWIGTWLFLLLGAILYLMNEE